MDKKTFAHYISENMQISDIQADIIIDIFTSNLAQAIFEGEPVDLENFGIFVPSVKLETNTSNDNLNSTPYNNDIMFLSGGVLKNNFVNNFGSCMYDRK